jgi:hypothetical protein
MKENGESEDLSKLSFFARLSRAINSNDPHNAVETDSTVHDMHDQAEVFEERTEGVFRYLQVGFTRSRATHNIN